MATFTNRATLSYSGGVVDSNIVTGSLLRILNGEKTAIPSFYAPDEEISYIISLRNTGSSALTGLTITDNLGAYTADGTTLYPMSYVPGSAAYYVNGVPQPVPLVTGGPPLVFSGLSIPAGGSAILIYRSRVNFFASPELEATITNTATVSGGGLSAPLVLMETISSRPEPRLSITKSLFPTTVPENGQLTYTIVIRNTGNTPALAEDDIVVTDLFDPILDPITVTYNGTPWVEGVNYTYDSSTGEFATVEGEITVPAATYTQNPDGSWSITPGVSTLTVTGTV